MVARHGKALWCTAATALAAWLVVAWPALAEACPNCARSTADGRFAYYSATALMLLVPIALLAGLVLGLRHAHAKQAQRAENEAIGRMS